MPMTPNQSLFDRLNDLRREYATQTLPFQCVVYAERAAKSGQFLLMERLLQNAIRLAAPLDTDFQPS